MTSIDLEAHFYTKAVFDYLATRKNYPLFVKEKRPGAYMLRFTKQISLFQNTAFIDILCNLGQARINAMDEAGLDIQVLSFSSPGIDEFAPDHHIAGSLAVELNDLIFETTKKYPTRFMGFASISPYDPKNSVKELERAITKLGFVGWLVHSNFGDDEYFDDKKYWPLLEAAESLNIPIYIHPTTPLMSEFGKYGFALGGPPLGFQLDVALCLLRMIYAGVFDQFPKLTIILGHMGETIPFLIPDRIDWAYVNPNISKLAGFIKERPNIKRTPSQVISDNVYVTTSGRFSKPLLDYILNVMGEHKVMLATDYPYESVKQSMSFIRGCNLSPLLLQKICSQNAGRLGIKLRNNLSVSK
ncbi:5-carboxyvanillate decarboxylase [Legionella jamestowniensis]|uniref:5-carboxyvanillate decarboxylase n=1 Tax=Legionella jamestowniensis TaxID=455 RepID=A0ABX2XT03_9GAMM|nr:amidohydrolase family protein [Legionella jamestowniensis]OCH97701.1 5-carboxyvanillate decarboxylase [Legionella jamestowniensis]